MESTYRLTARAEGVEPITLTVTAPAIWHKLNDTERDKWMMLRALEEIWSIDNARPVHGLEFRYSALPGRCT